MTANRCIPVEEIYRALELPEHDPRSAHLRECPRCRALADQFRAFVEASTSDMDQARLVAAESSLRAALERELAAPARPSEAGDDRSPAAAGGPARRPVSPRSSWWDAWFAPAWKPALALAAVIAVAGVLIWPRVGERPGEPVLRGKTPASSFAVEVANRGAQGVELRWKAIRGADLYEVRMFSTSLEEVGRMETSETTMMLSPDRLPPGVEKSGALLVRVAALRGGDELAISEVQTVDRP